MTPEDHTIPFGTSKGRTLGDVADDDLLYLDGLVGQEWFLTKFGPLAEAVGDICHDRANEIETLMAEGPRRNE